jgi:hypothetical protein
MANPEKADAHGSNSSGEKFLYLAITSPVAGSDFSKVASVLMR